MYLSPHSYLFVMRTLKYYFLKVNFWSKLLKLKYYVILKIERYITNKPLKKFSQSEYTLRRPYQNYRSPPTHSNSINQVCPLVKWRNNFIFTFSTINWSWQLLNFIYIELHRESSLSIETHLYMPCVTSFILIVKR
jgi:hypothetical protein